MQDLRWPTYPPRETFIESGTAPGSLRVRDSDGREYLDAVAGIGCAILGHGHPRWVAAITAQLGKIASVANSYRTAPQRLLADRLAQISPVKDGRVFFANTGTESTEAALKLCLRATGRDMVLAFERAFHGRTIGALSLTSNPKYRSPYINAFGEGHDDRFADCRVVRIPFNDVAALEQAFERHGKRLAAAFLEPVQGEGGVFPAPREFLLRVRELCHQHGALLAVDEIQTGIGRSGKWTAWEAIVGTDAPVDVIWYAKALGAGFPIGACVARADLAETMGLGTHGTTFGGNPAACAAGLATLEIIESESLLAAAGAQLPTLQRLAKANPIPEVTEIRGVGAMIGIQVGEIEAGAATELGAKMMEQGVLVTVPGGHTVRSLLPYKAGESELSELWEALRRSISGS